MELAITTKERYQKTPTPTDISVELGVFCHFPLFQELVDGFIQVFDGLFVVVLHRMDDAVADVVLEDEAADAFDGGVDGGELDEDVAAVAAVFDHLADGFEVADEACHAVEHGFRLRVGVTVRVGVWMPLPACARLGTQCCLIGGLRLHLTASVTVSPLMFHSFWWPASVS